MGESSLLERFRSAFKDLVTPDQETIEGEQRLDDEQRPEGETRPDSGLAEEGTSANPTIRISAGDTDIADQQSEQPGSGRENELCGSGSENELCGPGSENEHPGPGNHGEDELTISGSEDKDSTSDYVIIDTPTPPSPLPFVEQCIDHCPIEEIPTPDVVLPSTSGFIPSLDHIAVGQPQNMSPSFFDRSLEFLKREIDTIKYTIGTRPSLTHEQWFGLFNSEGQMIAQEQFNEYLLNYEWPGELLQEGWKFLFSYYDMDSQHDERVQSGKDLEFQLRESLELWQALQEMEGSEGDRVRKLVYLINKDVHRTDRDHTFYKDNPDNSDILRDLLVTYSFLNPDVGYVQGMNELLSLFLVTIEDNVAAYWSYHNYLTRNKIFYSSTGLMAKLNATAELVATHDMELYEKLVSLDCGNMLFCQRWLLLGFKRESKNFAMAVKIFTLLNTYQPSHYLTLSGVGKCDLLSLDMFLVVAVLSSYRREILSFKDQTDVYQWTCKLKLADMAAMATAKQLYSRYSKDD